MEIALVGFRVVLRASLYSLTESGHDSGSDAH